MTKTSLLPRSETDVCDMIAQAYAADRALEIRGGSTRAGFGRPVNCEDTICTAELSGIVLYEPSELVISAKAGTPLDLIEAELADRGLMLSFEPMSHCALFGLDGRPTIGAVVACNASGPRRIRVGAARDSLLGIRFVNGRGEAIKSGGRVMKNVTGLDLVRLSCGAHGTLGLLTEVTFKVLPRPPATVTLVFNDLEDEEGVVLLSRALGLPFEISGAAFLPAGLGSRLSRTLIRIEGFRDSVAYRQQRVIGSLSGTPNPTILSDKESAGLWREIADVSLISWPRENAVWRISVAPPMGPAVVKSLGIADGRYFYDWGGGLVWLASPAVDAMKVRQVVRRFGGYSTLVRAPDPDRSELPVFEPMTASIARLTLGIKDSLDPRRILNPGRMYAGI